MKFSFDDTICAPATSTGTGAVSIIRVSGSRSLEAVDALVSFKKGNALSSRGYTLKFGTIADVDDVVVSIYRSPASYTGEDGAEICCHASSYIVQKILEMLQAQGVRLAEPGEFTRRAFLNGKMDLAQAEAVADVIAAQSEAQHRVALNQLRGGYSQELRELRSKLVEMSALLELELDFSEEDVEFADRSALKNLLGAIVAKVDSLAESFRLGNAIKNGVPVAIVGAPNSGKSTLLNRLLGEDRAIVSDIPGTTRDTIEECMVLEGVRYRFIDTAGVRSTDDVIEAMGVERSLDAMKKADVVLGVVDATAASRDGDIAWLKENVSDGQTLIIVLNKMDLAQLQDVEGVLATGADEEVGASVLGGECGVGISALNGDGVDKLRKAIARSQEGRLNAGDATLVTNARHHAALLKARKSLLEVGEGLSAGLSPELLAEHLREAISDLGSITGEISTDEVLGTIFARFCIGK